MKKFAIISFIIIFYIVSIFFVEEPIKNIFADIYEIGPDTLRAVLENNTVKTDMIQDGHVTYDKLAYNSVGAYQIISSGVVAGTYTNATITVDGDGRISSASITPTGSNLDTIAIEIDAACFDSTTYGSSASGKFLNQYSVLKNWYYDFTNAGETLFVSYHVPAYIVKFIGYEVSGIALADDEDTYQYVLKWKGMQNSNIIVDTYATLGNVDSCSVPSIRDDVNAYVQSGINTDFSIGDQNSISKAYYARFMLYRLNNDAASENFRFLGMTFYFVRQVELYRTRITGH